MSVDLHNHMGTAMKSAGLPGTNADNTKVALGPSYPTGATIVSGGGPSSNASLSGSFPVGDAYNRNMLSMKNSTGRKSGNYIKSPPGKIKTGNDN